MGNTATELSQWNRIRANIAIILETNVAFLDKNDAIDMSKANYNLEAVQKWARDSKQSLETQNDIAEYRLHLNRKQGEWIEANIPEDGSFHGNQYSGPTKNSQPTLADVGINRNESPKFRILAKIPLDKFEAYLSESKEAVTEISTNDVCRLWKNPSHVSQATGENEWYTPPEYIESARLVMGSIVIDPPWPMKKIDLQARAKEGSVAYDTLTINQIKNSRAKAYPEFCNALQNHPGRIIKSNFISSYGAFQYIVERNGYSTPAA